MRKELSQAAVKLKEMRLLTLAQPAYVKMQMVVDTVGIWVLKRCLEESIWIGQPIAN